MRLPAGRSGTSKGPSVAPFEGMVNRGIQRALRKTGLREVTSSFSRLILQRSTSTEPSSQRDESVCLHLRPCPSLVHNFLTGFINTAIYISPPLSLAVFPLLFQLSQGHFRLRLSSRPIHGFFLSLPVQPASASATGGDQGASSHL